MRSRFGFDAKVKGLIVGDIDPSSPAASKNIRQGDVITEAQQEPVATTQDLEKAIEKVKRPAARACSCWSRMRRAIPASSRSRSRLVDDGDHRSEAISIAGGAEGDVVAEATNAETDSSVCAEKVSLAVCFGRKLRRDGYL